MTSHTSWMQSPSYKQYASDISPLLDLSTSSPVPAGTLPNIIHLNFHPHPPDTPRSAPVTEIAFFALPASASSSQKSALETAVTEVADLCLGKGGSGSEAEAGKDEKMTPHATSYATGWVVEPMDHHAGTEERAISLGLMVGWASKEDHLTVRKSEPLRRKWAGLERWCCLVRRQQGGRAVCIMSRSRNGVAVLGWKCESCSGIGWNRDRDGDG